MKNLLELNVIFLIEILNFDSPFWGTSGESVGDAFRRLFENCNYKFHVYVATGLVFCFPGC